jgi:hypothetical protein
MGKRLQNVQNALLATTPRTVVTCWERHRILSERKSRDNPEMGDHEGESTKRLSGNLADLAWVVSGGKDLGNLYRDFEYLTDEDQLEQIFRDAGIPWGRLVAEDAHEILNGRPPLYFMLEDERATLYRSKRGIPTPPPANEGFVSSDEVGRRLELDMERGWREAREYGVPLDLYKHSACYYEQMYFYKTQEWTNTAKAARFIAGYQCEGCRARGVELQVHHINPVISAYDRIFYRNFDFQRFSVLCSTCHKRFHSRHIRGDSYCFIMVDAHETKRYHEDLRRLTELHDSFQTCMFCQDRIAERYPNQIDLQMG